MSRIVATFNTQKAFSQARAHQNAGQLDDAEKLYRNLLALDPKNADVLHMLGLIARQRGQNEAAVDLIRTALKRKPGYPEAFYNLANALSDLGKLDEAIAGYRKSIALRPGFAKAHSNLGLLLAKTGQFEEAILAHRQVIHLDPVFPNAHYNLGNALRELHRFDEAIAAFQQEVTLRPDFAEAFHNLGFCLGWKGYSDQAAKAFSLAVSLNPTNCDTHDNLSAALRLAGRLDEAISVSQRAISLFPDSAASYCNLGHALNEKGLFDQAFTAYSKTISLDADLTMAYQGLAQVLEKQGKVSEAIAALQAGQERDVSSNIFSFALAALGVGEAPASPPPHYAIGLFNDYASTFDQHLVKTLNYVGPQLLFDAVNAAHPPKPTDIIDLGCGTGLCGELFRPLARHQIGIDLAPKMIEKARARGVYDELEEQDVTVALAKRPRAVDLILAADVFIYVGRLDAVFEAAAGALRPGGLMAFTIESEDTGDFTLRPSRRYAHSARYIRQLASAWNFAEVSMQDAVIRTEKQVPMQGKVIVLRSTA